MYPLLCYYPSQAGGPANTIYWLNKTFGVSGNQSIVLSTKLGLLKPIEGINSVFREFNIDVHFLSNSLFSFFKPKYIRKIKETEIIHFSSIFFPPTIFYILIGLINSKKIVISPRGELYNAALERKSLKKKMFLKIIQLIQRNIYFHSTNPFETSLLNEYFPRAKKIIEIPNFIEIPSSKNLKTKKQIVFLGRINPIKNIHLLIKAFNELPDELKNTFSLLIAGEAILSYEKSYLRKLRVLIDTLNLRKNIHFLGGIYGELKERTLSESFCTILPSKSENFGNVVLESLCQGTPVIVTKHAPWKILEESNAGIWIVPTVLNLKNAMIKLMTANEDEYINIRRNAHNLAIEKFDINQNIQIWIKFYNSLINPILCLKTKPS
jgi:glycosyltransferase involved in cell wall biosynthesis